MNETALKIAGLAVAILAAFAALMNALVALYSAWREHRWLKIKIEPKEWHHAPGPEGGRRVGFVVRLSAFNPARSGNALTSVKVWLNGQEAECYWHREPPDKDPTTIDPFEHFTGRIVVHAFNDYKGDPSDAYKSVRCLRVKLKFGRGFYRRRNFSWGQFPASTGR